MEKSITELAREHMRLRHSARMGVSRGKKKVVKCNCCGREGMETIPEEEPPFYCWRCSDKTEIGGFHEI